MSERPAWLSDAARALLVDVLRWALGPYFRWQERRRARARRSGKP